MINIDTGLLYQNYAGKKSKIRLGFDGSCLKWTFNDRRDEQLLSLILKQVSVMSDCASIYVFYHCVSVCMFVQSGGRQWAFVSQHPIFLLQVLTHTHTHTLPHWYFLLASVELPRFKDSKTGTIWYFHPASHFLPSPPTLERDKKMNKEEKRG